MTQESFYLTLLSNSSMTYFPTNTTANFITKLPKTIKLEGEWLVGLVEFNYPFSLLNVQEHENILYVKKKTIIDSFESIVEFKSHIPATTYDDVYQLLNALNGNNILRNSVKFRYDETSKLIHVINLSKDMISLSLSPQLSLQLGFGPNANLIYSNTAKRPVNLFLGLPSQLFVYSDIVQPQIVGDVMTSLLRIIPLNPTKYIYGGYKMNIFSPAHHIPVMRREFDTVEIDIRTSTGTRIPFQFGTACVKLHFRRIK